MERNVFIFHGTGGYPGENWFPWLKEELEIKGHTVIVPHFPTPEGESLGAWLKILEGYQKEINQDTILVGHSKGGLFLLRVLEQLENPIRAAVFVGTPIGVRPIKFYESDEKFSDGQGFSFNWNKIKSNTSHFDVFHSDNDPYVCLQNGEQLSNNLEATPHFIPNSGHFNAAAGYTKFPKLLEILEPLLGE